MGEKEKILEKEETPAFSPFFPKMCSKALFFRFMKTVDCLVKSYLFTKPQSFTKPQNQNFTLFQIENICRQQNMNQILTTDQQVEDIVVKGENAVY